MQVYVHPLASIACCKSVVFNRKYIYIQYAEPSFFCVSLLDRKSPCRINKTVPLHFRGGWSNPPPPSKHHQSNGDFFRCWIWRSLNLPSTAPHYNHVTLFQGGWEWTFSKTPIAISQMAQTCSQNGTNPHSFTWLTVCHAVAFSNSSPAFQRWME